MEKFSRIYAAANKCGFDVKTRFSAETGKAILGFNAIDIDLDIFFCVCVDDHANETQFVNNVAHELFLISEDLADKIRKSAKDKTERLKSQLKVLISIYSLDNTL